MSHHLLIGVGGDWLKWGLMGFDWTILEAVSNVSMMNELELINRQ